MTSPDMRYGIIREPIVLEGSYTFDGKLCHVCNLPTVIGEDVSRRYCSNVQCNALIVE